MSDSEDSEFEEKLLELNNWQTEQQMKLKQFQEAQRKLLDSEHEKILSTLKTQNYEQRHAISETDPSFIFKLQDIESGSDTQMKLSKPNCMFNVQSDTIKLKDPKINLCGISQCENSDELFDNVNDEYEETVTNRPRRFLRRGDGLARFRMTFADFKTPPDIYKEKKIKTYLRQKPEIGRKGIETKGVRSFGDISKRNRKTICSKTKTVPVNIYVPENKPKKVNPIKTICNSAGSRLSCSKNRDVNPPPPVPPPKAPVRNLMLKPVHRSNFPNSQSAGEPTSYEKPTDKSQNLPKMSEDDRLGKLLRKDERELRMFEMLEDKIDEGTLSTNSSLVARFMEESVSSTPSKIDSSKDEAFSYLESLRALQRRYLTPEQINRIQECDEEYMSEDSQSIDDMKVDDKMSENTADNFANLDLIEEDKANEESEKEFEMPQLCETSEQEDNCISEESPKQLVPLLPQPLRTNKTLLQEYIENFKKLKREMKENCVQSVCEEIEGSVITEGNSTEDQALTQREIAIKLQRKALQDNVKNLLNWEGPPRKKQPKKPTKKPLSARTQKQKKPENPDEGKIIFSDTELRDRLAELEKEIEIFKRENKSLNQLRRDCESEKSKWEKERKEFEKYMQQEREKFEAKMSEEQKKLQREKAVFDKYCKHIKNQPNKKEREEITNLKAEIERLTEVISTKDSRWGASQARLRNQIKGLEKENNELKMEIEKLKKQTVKKVTFESEKNINTKIIHAINSELGKLKPQIVNKGGANQKYQASSARVDSNLQKKPVRRIKSVPDLKKSSEKGMLNTENMIESISAADGDKENKARFSFPGDGKNEIQVQRMNKIELTEGRPTVKADWLPINNDGNSNDEECPNHLFEEDTKKKCEKNCWEDAESVLRETLFENRDHGDNVNRSGTICEIKRRLGNLNLLQNTEPFNGEGDRNTALDCDSVVSSGSEDDDVDMEYNRTSDRDSEMLFENKCEDHDSYNSAYLKYMCQTNADGRGVREKKYDDGRREIIYPNGNVKKISADGRIVKMIYYNGDLKETDIVEGSEKYYYAQTKTWHTTYKDGLEVLEFPNGQTERRLPDGSTEILFPNGCVRYCDPSGKDEWRFLDGTVIKTDKNGHKVLLLPNGQKEIHTKEYKVNYLYDICK
ncbi:UNVERIFIED_CONTAM: hypothetical protein PYX00_009079 [Menopon gallinae]|uniref:Centromere protein J C-terminal domain-containing protein n=2 Tax=Menopon gallinae TaxID=328185 RepID=A0AAW2H9X0_9NEOP